MNEEQENPCPILPGESAKAYEAASVYFRLGAQRSQVAVARRLGKSTKQLEKWSPRYDWVKRAAAFDACMAQQDLDKWLQRARERREAMYQRGERLHEAAELMLKYPLSEVKRVLELHENGQEKQIQIIKAVRWSRSDVVLYMEAGDAMTGAAIRNEDSKDFMVEKDNWNLTSYKGADK